MRRGGAFVALHVAEALAKQPRDMRRPKSMSSPLVINDKVTLPGSDLEWTAVRASGPGGQNVNKVASKIELSFDFESTVALTDPVKARLRVLAKNQLDAEGASSSRARRRATRRRTSPTRARS